MVEELDYETILAERIATLISLYPEGQQEAVSGRTCAVEPIVKLLRKSAPTARLSGVSVSMKLHAVAYAIDSDLDNMGEISVLSVLSSRLLMTRDSTPRLKWNSTPIIVCVYSRL